MKRYFTKPGFGFLLLLSGCAWIEDRPGNHVIRIVSDLDNGQMYFEPRELQIAPGDTVTWVNTADVDHNMVSYPDGYPKGATAFQSPDLSEEGERWSYRFEVAGSYEYHCVPHIVMDMEGTVVVGRPSDASAFHEPSAAEIASYRELLWEYFDKDEGVDYRPRAERAAASATPSQHHTSHASH